MSTMDVYESYRKEKSPATADRIRDVLLNHTKEFKTSWVNLGRALYPVWKDKLFLGWGYEKFEHYTQKELGLKQAMAVKLLKSYFFLEQEEPAYLAREFTEGAPASRVPSCDAVNFLRLARQKKELTKDDYRDLKTSLFEKGRELGAVRKDLVSLIKERRHLDPEQEREDRNTAAVQRLINALKSFKKDMDALKLFPAALVEESQRLLKQLEEQVGS